MSAGAQVRREGSQPPLRGIRVLESTTMITGSLAGMMLADLGADVIKVENPDGGDPFRSFRGGNDSPYFLAYNRNKRSIALDLRSDQGRDIYLRLVAAADVLIENFRPGVLDRLGLGRAVLTEANPRLLICSITGFGSGGPYRDRPAYDAVAQALSGMSSLFFVDRPQITGPTIADNLTGIYACYGILGALVRRERQGKGCVIEVNMLDAAIAFMPDAFLTHTLLGIPSGPLARVSASQSFAFRCSDRQVLAIHLSSRDKFWRGALEAFERPELADDPRFKERSARIDHYCDLANELGDTIERKPRDYWLRRLEANEVPHAPVNNLAEVIKDPQVAHLGSFVDMGHKRRGPYKAVRRPVCYDGSRDDQPLAGAPDLNEHGDSILRDDLGLDAAAIERWRAHTARAVARQH